MDNIKKNDKVDLIINALNRYYYTKMNDKVYGREQSTDYNYAKGYLIGMLTAYKLNWSEINNQAIITYQNSGKTLYVFNIGDYK